MLKTKRLELFPARLEHLECELRDAQALGALLGANISAEWPPGEYDRDAMEFFRTKLGEEGRASVGWYVWYVLMRATPGQSAELVAGAGYFGPPANGAVEIGLSVVPSFRGRGFAGEIIAALVDRAFEVGSVDVVYAHTTDANIGSIRALRRCGFQSVGPGREPGSVQFAVRSDRWQ
jgi:RimJ/RimL family protein N-acetyltransferase